MPKYDYAIIKYMPDLRRGEVFNVGLIVFHTTSKNIKLDVHLANQDKIEKIKKFTRKFNEPDDDRDDDRDLETLLETLKSNLAIIQTESVWRNIDEAHCFLSSFFSGNTYLSTLGYFKVAEDEDQYTQKISQLFAILID